MLSRFYSVSRYVVVVVDVLKFVSVIVIVVISSGVVMSVWYSLYFSMLLISVVFVMFVMLIMSSISDSVVVFVCVVVLRNGCR